MTASITKDSGERHEYVSGMNREPEGERPRFDLLVPEGIPYEEQFLTRCAALMARGAAKYASRNWENACTGMERDRMKSSAFRHFMQWMCGEDDEDHAAAVLFNVMAAETTQYKISHSTTEPGLEEPACDHFLVRAVVTGYTSPDLMVCEDCGASWDDPRFGENPDEEALP